MTENIFRQAIFTHFKKPNSFLKRELSRTIKSIDKQVTLSQNQYIEEFAKVRCSWLKGERSLHGLQFLIKEYNEEHCKYYLQVSSVDFINFTKKLNGNYYNNNTNIINTMLEAYDSFLKKDNNQNSYLYLPLKERSRDQVQKYIFNIQKYKESERLLLTKLFFIFAENHFMRLHSKDEKTITPVIISMLSSSVFHYYIILRLTHF